MAVITFNPFTGLFDISPSLTFPGTLVIASGKTATINNTLTFAGTDGTTMTFPTTSATVARTDAANTFTLANNTTMTVAGGSVTGSGTTPFLSVTGTWNTSGVATAVVFNVINTASGTGSVLLDVQKGSVSQFSLCKDGTQTWGNGTDALIINGNGSSGLIRFNPQNVAGRHTFSIDYLGNMQVGSGGSYNWSTAALTTGGAVDLSLWRDAANTLAQRNGAAAQIFNVGNTVTTPLTAGEWFTIDWATTANVVNLQAVKGSSSGAARVMTLSYGGLKASPVAAVTIPITSGNIVFGGGVQLSNAAVTGLTAGVLAATTNATIVLYDSTGQAYRVPCII